MAHRFLKLSLVCMAIIASTDLKAQQAPVLWYDSPAEYWEEALPLGMEDWEQWYMEIR